MTKFIAPALCVFILISIWQWTTISASIISLILTLPVTILGVNDAPHHISADLWEYWAAAAIWLATVALGIHWLVKTYVTRQSSPPRAGEATDTGLSKTPAVFVLFIFVYIALMAPFLAPFQPAAQGDLTSTRLLKPFTKGICLEPAPTGILLESNARETSWLAAVLRSANHTLVNRRETFTRDDRYANISAQTKTFFLGTDDLGRDVLSRVIYGSRISLAIGFVAMICSVILGCLIGFAAGLTGGWVDRALMHLTDLFLAVPSLFLVIVLVAFLGNSVMLLIGVLAATGWMTVARLVRAEVMTLREREFILAARLLGRSSPEIIRYHIIPNVLPTILVASVLQLSNIILAEAALSFLGLGIQPPTPSWGNMIGESMAYLGSGWWVGVFPGVALSTLVVSANRAAELIERWSKGRT